MIESDEIGLYESLCRISERMLREAEEGRWDDIVPLEQQHSQVSARLREMDGRGNQFSEHYLERKAMLITQILGRDEKTQSLIKQRMDTLQKDGAEERKIMRAYGAQTF